MQRVKNQSKPDEKDWTADGLIFHEVIRQEYGNNNCVFNAGAVEGHEIDTMFVAWKRDGDEGGMLLLTPDEMAAFAWCATGVLWSYVLGQRLESNQPTE